MRMFQGGAPGKAVVDKLEEDVAGPSEQPAVINRPILDICQESECCVCLDNKVSYSCLNILIPRNIYGGGPL